MAAEAAVLPETVVSEIKRRLKLMPIWQEVYSEKWCMANGESPFVKRAKATKFKVKDSHVEPTLQRVLKWCKERLSAGIKLTVEFDKNRPFFIIRRAYPEEEPDYEAKRKKELTDTVAGALADALKNLAVSGKAPSPEVATK